MHPGAADACGDGIDQDCDGLDPGFDEDGDGYVAAYCGGDDCDDTDDDVSPGSDESCNGIDDNCDGLDWCPLEPAVAEALRWLLRFQSGVLEMRRAVWRDIADAIDDVASDTCPVVVTTESSSTLEHATEAAGMWPMWEECGACSSGQTLWEGPCSTEQGLTVAGAVSSNWAFDSHSWFDYEFAAFDADSFAIEDQAGSVLLSVDGWGDWWEYLESDWDMDRRSESRVGVEVVHPGVPYSSLFPPDERTRLDLSMAKTSWSGTTVRLSGTASTRLDTTPWLGTINVVESADSDCLVGPRSGTATVEGLDAPDGNTLFVVSIDFDAYDCPCGVVSVDGVVATVWCAADF